MAENTKFLNLKKPAPEDFYDVNDFNENFQKIDDFADGLKFTKEQVGLGNVDNTSDADKPVSTAQAEAINNAKNEEVIDLTDFEINDTSIVIDKKLIIKNQERCAPDFFMRNIPLRKLFPQRQPLLLIPLML